MSPGLIAGVLLFTVADGAPNPAPPKPAGMAARADALARFGAGLWQARRDRLLSAAKSLEAAAKDDPDATEPLKELVRVYSQIGREPDAIRAARTVLDKDPTDADTAHALSRLLFDAGELSEAVAVAKFAAENVDATTRPDKALAVYRDLATLLEKADEPAAAEAPLRQTVTLLTENRKAVITTGGYTPKEADAATADALERLGTVLVKQKRAAAAVDAFRAAHALYADPRKANDPASAARLDWNLSDAYAAHGDPATALAHLDAFLKLKPQAVAPFERLVVLMNQTGRGGEAATTLRKHAERDPKNLSLLAVYAAELARTPEGRAGADSLFTQLSEATNDPKIVRVAVRSHVEAGRAGRVVAALDRAYQRVASEDDNVTAKQRTFAAEKARAIADVLRVEPAWAGAVLLAASDDLSAGTYRTYQTWYVVGTLAARHRKLDLAAVQFRQAVGTAPEKAQGEAYEQLIRVLWLARKPADVAAVCREGLRSATLGPAYFNTHLADALAELGDADEALAAADKAISQAGEAYRLTYRLRKAAVLKTLGRWDEAVTLCRKLLDEFDAPADRTRIRRTLAGAYWGAKKHAEAEAELRAVLDTDPDDPGACNDLGYHLAEQGRNLDEAERLLRRAVAADRADRRRAGDPEPENAAYLDSLAWVLFRKGRLADARDLLEKVVATPDGAADAVVWDHLGDAHFRMGDKDKAKAAWDRAAALFATDPRGKHDGRLDETKRKLKRVP